MPCKLHIDVYRTGEGINQSWYGIFDENGKKEFGCYSMYGQAEAGMKAYLAGIRRAATRCIEIAKTNRESYCTCQLMGGMCDTCNAIEDIEDETRKEFGI